MRLSHYTKLAIKRKLNLVMSLGYTVLAVNMFENGYNTLGSLCTTAVLILLANRAHPYHNGTRCE